MGLKVKLFAEHLIGQIIVFWFFFALYRMIGFNDRNFTFINNRNNASDADLMTTLWYAVCVHCRMGAADVLPTSPLSRAFSALHTLLTFAMGSSNIVDVVSATPTVRQFSST